MEHDLETNSRHDVMKLRNVPRTNALPEKESINYKCSLFLCLTERTGTGRPGPYNVKLTVLKNNSEKIFSM